MMSFNLANDPWVPVAWELDGPSEVSLIDIFGQAQKIRRILGNPLEVAVISRLLLAIAHRVRTPKNPYEWMDLWQDPEAFFSEAAEYLAQNAACFNLYGDARPFAQHPGLPLPSGTTATLIYDRAQGNNPVFLDGSQVCKPQAVSSPIAARALLVTHAFAGSGTGGNNPLNGGKKDTMYAGPLCARMVAFVEGDCLSKTILLNLVSERKQGRPSWERDLAETPGIVPSEGMCDLYTRCTRLARLRQGYDGKSCTAASAYMGQALPAEETDATDPTIPRYLAQDKKVKALRLSPDRASWRSANVLLAAKVRNLVPPLGALEQLRPLVANEQFSRKEPVALRILGVAANAQGPVTEMWRDETLSFGLSLIADDDRYEAMLMAIETAESTATRLRGRLYGFAKDYMAGGDGNPDPKDVGRLADELAPGLNDFWSAVGPRGERIALDHFDFAAWRKELDLAAAAAFRRAVDRLPADARRFKAEYARRQVQEGGTPKRGKKAA